MLYTTAEYKMNKCMCMMCCCRMSDSRMIGLRNDNAAFSHTCHLL